MTFRTRTSETEVRPNSIFQMKMLTLNKVANMLGHSIQVSGLRLLKLFYERLHFFIDADQ